MRNAIRLLVLLPLSALATEFDVRRGICVLLDDVDGSRALKLARETELVIYSQLPDAQSVERARRAADAAGLLNTRIYVERGPITRIGLADNLADTVIAPADAPETEVLRVLQPRATALIGNRKVTKPPLNGADDWTHPYHGADNNPVSNDRVVRAPYLTQFLADPRYAPLPQVAVASAGRVFKAFGHIAFKEREEEWLDTLAAFNGYNGTLLWRRPLPPALMVHRNTIIATPDTLFFGDDKSCKLIDAATGEVRDEIVVPEERPGWTFWKWMALEDGVLYALVGEQELRDPVLRTRSERRGWPWNPLSPGFNAKELVWGFGHTLYAINPKTKEIIWHYREKEPFDARALCMKSGRIYGFRFGSFLVCLDAKTGKPLWRKTPDNAPEIFSTLGEPLPRQDWRTNWRTAAYLKCSDRALYFAGPPVNRLLAVSAENGKLLWEHPYDNYQLVLLGNLLYGIPGSIDKDPARKFNALTGQVLSEIPIGRRACTRPTASCDAILFRAGEGSTRLDLATEQPQLISPMRAQCHDGVTIANGLLYWWPSTCDCNLSLLGITALGPAGDFNFNQPAVESDRLEQLAAPQTELTPTAADWPMFRANHQATASTPVAIPERARKAWEFTPNAAFTPTAPTAAGDLVFASGSDGVVRAFHAATGRPAWKTYTGGVVLYPPTIWQGRAFVGSSDGYAYCLEARTGRLLWRFRAAPAERRIPVYGRLQSTWPVASGVLVHDGVAYFAAGIANYDGTHVFALDAATGRIRWQNNSSGHLDPDARTGVGVQGHMLIAGGKLYMAGGNAVSPAIYDLRDGRCLNDVAVTRQKERNNIIGARAPRGSELYLIGNEVLVGGKPLYAHPRWQVYDPTVQSKTLLAAAGERVVAWVNNARLLGFARKEQDLAEIFRAAWGKPQPPRVRAAWEVACKDSTAVAVAPNAVVVATPGELAAYDTTNGRLLWKMELPANVVPWGLAVDRDGRIIAALENGLILCLEPEKTT
ncbi:MAG: PQQ-binding-like beta-propeller repeat protein [Verrucomicrobiae bacterium]|nr:PQQ-binding-like beta-propeller repeat protein [Verrucomicrobiae bacterium]